MSIRHGVTKRAILIVVSGLLCLETLSSGSHLQIPSGTWAPTANLLQGRAGAASVVLNDGRILIAGGQGAPDGDPLSSVELYTSDDAFAPAAPMLIPRKGQVAVALKDGRVLVAGGVTSGSLTTPASEIYDPSSDSWAPAGDLVDARSGATASLLDDGRVLVAGGQGINGVLASLEIFDPIAASFSYAGAMSTARKGHTASALPDGRALIAGGSDGTSVLASTELYDPEAGTVDAGPDLSQPRTDHTATTLPNGNIVLIGGSDGNAELASADVLDATAETFALAPGQLAAARRGHQAYLLPHNNHVLIVGGTSGGQSVATAEFFTSWTGAFEPTGSPSVARLSSAGAALSDDGLLLVAGGAGAPNALASAEMFGFATVKTDKDDYAPNETLTITGGGWQPGESVSLLIHEMPAIHEDIVVPVVADSSGKIFEDDYVFEPHQFGVRFTLTATGTRSVAQTTFTDARQFAAAIAPTTTSTGTPTNFTVTVTNTSALSEIMDCVRIAVPSGAGTPGSSSVLATDSHAVSRIWSTPSLAGGFLTTTRLGSSSNSIDPGGTVVVQFTTNPSSAGSQEWTTAAFGATDCSALPFAIPDEQPTVNVTAGTGNIVIINQALPHDAQDFSFTTTGGLTPSAFSLDDDGNNGNELSNTQAFNDLPAGPYSVTQAAVPGWDLTPVQCVDPNGGTQISGATVNINLTAGETVTCTYTNTKRGSIIVEKQTVPPNAPGSFTFEGAASGTISAGQQIVVGSLAPGAYTVNEDSPSADFDLTSITCDDGNSTGSVGTLTATFRVEPGETVKCTFTNTERGTVKLAKIAAPHDATDSFAFTSDLSDLSASVMDGGTLTALHVKPGAYTATEQGPVAGFFVSSIVCDDANSTVNVAAQQAVYHVDPGETVTCTFTNTKRGAVIVKKETNPAGNTTDLFAFTSALPGLTGSIKAGQSLSQSVVPGVYTAAEVDPRPVFDLSSIVCDDGNSTGNVGILTATFHVEPGETVTCTFTNTKRGTIIVEKQALPDVPGGSFSFTGNAAGTIANHGQITVANLAPGPYTSTEDVIPLFDLTSITCDDDGSLTKSSGDIVSRTATFKLDPGETVKCTFTNTKEGTLVVTKRTEPTGLPDSFPFSSADVGALNGSLSDGQSLTATQVKPGTYTVLEASVAAGFDLTDVTCDDVGPNASVGDVAHQQATFHLDPGETVHCTFTNTKHGHLVVKKVTSPSGDPTSFPFHATGAGTTDFSLTDGGSRDQELSPGTYSVSELVPAGWDLSASTCTGGPFGAGASYTSGAPITLGAGQTITCTFTDTKHAHLAVNKVTNPTTDTTTSFPFHATGSGYTDFSLLNGGSNDQGLSPGSYTIAEQVPAGWDLSAATCIGGPFGVAGGPYTNGGSIVLGAGQTVTCTFNDTKRGHLVVNKITNPNTDTTTSFPFNATGSGYGNFSLLNGGSNDQGLSPGAYAIAEQVPTGWDLSTASCVGGPFGMGGPYTNGASIALGAGQTIACTFTDTQRSHLIVDKVTNPSGDPTSFTFTGGGGGYGSFSLTDAATPNDQTLVPGSYTIAEQVPSGWDLTAAACVGGSFGVGGPYTNGASIALGAGQTIACTFTDTKRGHLVVNKITNPNTDTTTSFPFHATGSGYTDFSLLNGGSNDQGLSPGAYTVAEQVPAGWDLTGATCVGGPFGAGGGPYANGGSIVLGAGQAIACTFSDTKRAHLIVDKVTNPSGDPTSFTFTAGGGSYAGFSLTDAAAPNDQTLVPGSYSITEQVPAGWELSTATCVGGLFGGGGGPYTNGASIALGAGDSVTCTFTDTKHGHLVVNKITNPNTDTTTSFPFHATGSGYTDFSLTGGGSHDSELVPGTYTAAEQVPAGWDLSTAACVGGPFGVAGGPYANGGSIVLGAGQTITCTFTDTMRGHLIVDRVTNPSGDPTSFTFTAGGGSYAGFSLTDAAPPNDQTLVPGSYTIAEQVPAGWDLSSATCLGGLFGAGGGPYTNGASIALGAGQTITCTFTDTKRSHLIVDEITNPSGDATSFTFTAGGGSYASFSLTDAATPNDQTLVPGSYTITEQVPAGWDLSGVACAGGSFGAGGPYTNGASIAVAAGQTITCAFTDTKRGTIIVEKQTLPDGAPGNFTFSGAATGTIMDNGQITVANLTPGPYDVSEGPSPNFDLTSISCDDDASITRSTVDLMGRTAHFQVDPGETVHCTFVNTEQGIVIVQKQTDPPNVPGVLFGFTSSLTGLTGSIGAGGSLMQAHLPPQNYSVTEVATPGFDLTDIVCDDTHSDHPSDGIVGTATATFRLDPGETVKCTFTNTQRSHLIVDNVTNPGGDPTSFNFTAGGGSYAGFSLTDAAPPNDQTLVPGNYTIAEQVPAGWDSTGATCVGGPFGVGGGPYTNGASIAVGAGQTITCTFTNTRRSHLIVDKVTNPSGDPTSFNFTAGGGTYASFSLTDAALPNDQTLVPGSYTIAEQVPVGWNLTGATCVGGPFGIGGGAYTNGASIALGAGQTITCTFTDTRQGHLVINKITNPNTDTTTSFAFQATGSGYAGFSLLNGGSNDQSLSPGTYTIAEQVTAGWDLSASMCAGGVFGAGASYTGGASIVLAAGQTITCTFTNTERGQITVDKVTNPSGDPTSFSFVASGAGYGSFNLTDAASPNVQTLVPGTYAIAETATPGWTLSAACVGGPFGLGASYTNGSPIVLGAGQIVNCTFTNTKVVTGSLVAAYGFNEGYGYTAHDSSGNNNDGMISDADWSSSGKYGKALSFDGINDWVTVDDDPSLDLSGAMTLEAWVKPTALNGWRPILYKESPFDPGVPISEPAMSWALYASDFGAPPSVYAMTSADSQEWIHALGPSNIPLNTWTHIAGTYDGSNLRLYVNGVLVRTTPHTGPMFGSMGPLRIGGSSVVTSIGKQFFKGLIDEIRVYNRALSQTEIQTDRVTPLP